MDSHSRLKGHRLVWEMRLDDKGEPHTLRPIFDFGKGRGGDGLRLDVEGRLWVAAGIMLPRNSGETADVPPGIYVIEPTGKLAGRIPIPEDVITNLAFGGPDRKTLYVTAGKSIFKVPVAVSGYALYPPPAR